MAKLLQGSARVLTPTNLITNSDFEFNGGYPNPYTYNGTTSGTINFEQDLQLICYSSGTTFVKNVTFTRSEGVLRITGMVQGLRSDSHIRINDNDEFLRKNRYYTLGASMKDNLGTVKSFQCYFQNDANIIYNTVLYPNGDTTNWYKPQMIEGTTVNGQQNVRLAVIYFGVTNGFIPFDVSIKEPYIYEGTYINPPFFESLDVKTQGWAMRRDCTNSNQASYRKILSLTSGLHQVGVVGHSCQCKFILSVTEIDSDNAFSYDIASANEIYEVTTSYRSYNADKNYRNSLIDVKTINVLNSDISLNIVQNFSIRSQGGSILLGMQVKVSKKYLLMSFTPVWILPHTSNPWQLVSIYNYFGSNRDSSSASAASSAGQTVVPTYSNLVIKP